MAFLHSEKEGFKIELIQNGDKSSYGPVGQGFSGHLKSYSLEDTTFDISGIDGQVFKFTIKECLRLEESEKLNVQQADKLQIDGQNYIVKDVKNYLGVRFDTTKILLAKK